MGGGNEIHLYTEDDGKLQLPVNMEQVDIDVEYWSRYGKTDQIILNPNPEDYEFTIWPNYTEYGYDCYRNEGKVFGTFYYPWCGTSEEEMRFVFMRPGTNEIVEQFSADRHQDEWGIGWRTLYPVLCDFRSRYIPACAVIPQERRNDVVQGS